MLAASKGLGRASAAALAAEGANVVIGARDADILRATANEIQLETGSRVVAVPTDVTNSEDAQRIVDTAISEFGRIDVLVNNAGGPPFAKFDTFDDAQWRDAFELSFLSTARLCRLAAPHMRQSGGGRIINILSLSVKTVLDGSVLSTSMRLGVVGMTKLLSDGLAPCGITVNNVAPGFILTDRVRQTSLKSKLAQGMTEKEGIADLARSIPMGRLGKPEEIGAIVAFLASAQACYITGITVPVDGGRIRSIY